ncbi:MAG: hypothetical protein DRP71_10485 [Verrucomicrobia bacterium]|nr:MAG: hypothetical protein DRP71_10485 [Verrucomicrobiota bacterium]
MAETDRKIHGVVTAVVTPLDAGGGVDEKGLQRLIERQIDGGVNGIFVLGSVGEGVLLSDVAALGVASIAVATVAGRCPVLAGASDNSTGRCLKRLEELSRMGVDYGVVTLPFYGWPGRVDDSVRFFKEVAADSPLPLMAYNLPKAVGWKMPVEALEQLFEISNIIGIKDTHADYDGMEAIASALRPAHFSYLPGNSMFAAGLLKAGADGVVSTPANIFPEPFADLYRSFCEGRMDVVDRIDRELIPLLGKLLTVLPTGAGSIKAALELQGVCTRHTVSPWPEASESDLEGLKKLLDETTQAIDRFQTDDGK